MGMTIDEAIIALDRDIHNARICGYQIDQYKVAIDTMRKYQEVELIFKTWCEVGDDGDICAFRKLKQVICPCIGDKDENVD